MASSFLRVEEPHEFFEEPARRYIVGRTACFWQDGTRAFGTIAWGRPTLADAELMTRVYEAVLQPSAKGHSSITDIRHLEAVDVTALEALIRFLVSRRSAWQAAIGRQALIHRSGVMGATIAGVMTLAGSGYPIACFESDAASAYQWAGISDLHAELEALHEQLAGVPELVRRVRDALNRHGLLDTDQLAAELAMSPRSLQRHLRGAGTTLRAERRRHLDREVERLLSGTDLDLDAIAATVGLSSASHLIRVFQQGHGVSPSVWRERERPSAD
ncbi:MAG: AraC family transcriptional regulator [Polyangiaceae bacterium]